MLNIINYLSFHNNNNISKFTYYAKCIFMLKLWPGSSPHVEERKEAK